MSATRCPRSLSLRLSLPLVLLLLLMVSSAFANVTVASKLEVVSGKMLSVSNATGKKMVPDLAAAGQILVQLQPSATEAQFADLLQRTGYRVLRSFSSRGMFLLQLPANTTVVTATSALLRESIIKLAEPDRRVYSTMSANDPYSGQQYHWNLIQADRAWDYQKGSSSVVVAVLDTGVDLTHEDLESRIWVNTDEIPDNHLDDDNNGFVDDVNGWDFFYLNNDPNPNYDIYDYREEVSHGTHCAGAIGAASNNAVGVTGHDWNCRIMPVQVMCPIGGFVSDAIAGIEYAVNNGANVISMSLGTSTYVGMYTQPITDAYLRGVTVVVAAGNDDHMFTDLQSTWGSPICNDGDMPGDNHVLGVGASDLMDQKAEFSNYDGSTHNFVDVMAPGVAIYSTYYYNPAAGFTERYGLMSGTSMACPVTAGLVSLMKAQYPAYTPDQIIARMRGACANIDTMNPGYVGQLGAGRINSPNSMGDLPPATPRSVTAYDTPQDEGGSITVSWALSLDDGKGANDVTRYEIMRGDTSEGPFTGVGSVDKGSREYIDTTVADFVDYYYQVVAFDASASTASRVTEPARARDDLAPPAVTVTAADTQGDSGGSISISWSSYVSPFDFGEYRIYRDVEAFSDVTEMTPLKSIASSGTKTYQDKATEDNQDYYYAVVCMDNSQPANGLKAVTCCGPVRSNPNYAFGFTGGLSMISIGLTVPDNHLDHIFDFSRGGMLSRFDPDQGVQGGYRVYAPGADDSFLLQMPGRGFWLHCTQPTVLNLSGAAATTDTRIEFSAGWNQLGNPYVDDVTVNAADKMIRIGGTSYTLEESNSRGFTRDYMWGWNSATNSYKLISVNLPFSTRTIRKGEGFFFLSTRPGQLVLTNPSLTTPTEVAGEAQAKPVDVDWFMQIKASTDGVADTDNFLGVAADPERVNGIVSPPPAKDGFDFAFTGASGTGAATSFVNTLGASHSWQATLTCNRPGAQVQLNWPDLSTLPRDCRPMLKDLATGKAVYMRTVSAYSFALQRGETQRRFLIDISSKAGDSLAIHSLQTVSGIGGGQIFYSLSAPATVDIEVVNLAGRLIRRLSGRLQQAGACSTLWNGLTDSGSSVPSGSYLFRLTARTADGQSVSAVQSLSLQR
ncbi:MAG: S8 family serine peptidase [Armatimonadota bacterium]